MMKQMEEESNKSYGRFCRPPSPSEILEAFPHESRKLGPKILRQKRKLLALYERVTIEPHLKGVPERHRELTRLLVEGASPHYEYMAKLRNDIQRLETLVRLSKQGGPSLNVEKAREYPIEQLCQELGIELRRAGRYLKALCPLHGECHPSFVVYTSQNHFYCYGCGEHGDVITLVQKLRVCSFVEAVSYLTGESLVSGVPQNDKQERIRISFR